MKIVWIGLMVVALLGILWSAKNQKKNTNAQTFAIVSLVAILVAAGGILSEFGIFGGPSSEIKSIIKTETRFAEVKAEILAKHLAQKYPGQSVIILVDNTTEQSPVLASSIETFKSNLSGMNIVGTETITIPEPDPNSPVTVDDLYTAKVVNKVLERCKNAQIIVNFATLPSNPAEITQLSIWKMKNGPKLAFYSGDISMLRVAIKQGFVVAAIAQNDKMIDPNESAPSDAQAAFDKRYVLVNPENVDKVAQELPNTFTSM